MLWRSVVETRWGEVLQGRVVKKCCGEEGLVEKCCEGVVKWCRDVLWGSVV